MPRNQTATRLLAAPSCGQTIGVHCRPEFGSLECTALRSMEHRGFGTAQPPWMASVVQVCAVPPVQPVRRDGMAQHIAHCDTLHEAVDCAPILSQQVHRALLRSPIATSLSAPALTRRGFKFFLTVSTTRTMSANGRLRSAHLASHSATGFRSVIYELSGRVFLTSQSREYIVESRFAKKGLSHDSVTASTHRSLRTDQLRVTWCRADHGRSDQ